MYTISASKSHLWKDGVEIVQDDRYKEYRDYVQWLKQGNGPEEVPDPEPVRPRITVSAWQIRKALNQAGLRQAVEDAVAASNNIELKDGWYHSPQFFSDNPLTLGMGASLGKDTEAMYALFQLAERL